MEENSAIFAVDSGQCSEDEDDDIQRKEELRQLLSEQLADDLLDDTMSTSVEEEVSLVSSPRHSQSPQLSQADVTPDGTPSHDSHMTYDYPKALKSPTGNDHHLHGNEALYSTEYTEIDHQQVTGFGEAFSQGEPDLLTLSPFKLRPPLPVHAVNDTSDVFAGTSQAYVDQALGLPTSSVGDSVSDHFRSNMVASQRQDGVLESHDMIVPSHDYHPGSHDLQYVNSQSDVSTYSDCFPTMLSEQTTSEHAQTTVANGYPREHPINVTSGHSSEHTQSLSANVTSVQPTGHAQALLSNVTSEKLTEHAQYLTSTAYAHPTPITPSQDIVLTTHTHTPSRQEQLEILYHARGRQINQLTQQLAASAEDTEKHIRILRHEKLLVENEKTDLSARLEQLEALHHAQEESIANTQGLLAAEQVRSSALEANKAELISRLQAAEATVNSLTKQVTELTSSDTLSRIRDNYSQALNTAAHEHRQELLSVQKEAETYREKLEDKNDVISKLEQQIRELEHRLSQQQQSQSSHKSKHDDGSQETSVVGQLEYGCEGCDGVRVVELVGRVEDLTFQLTTTQEELQQALERSNQAESELRASAERLGEVELERGQLLGHVTSLQTQLEEVKVQAEAEKKAALEHCRSACLKLHEESTQRLRETIATEKQRLTQDSDRQASQLKSDLTTVQEQYVAVCVEKDKLETELTELKAQKETALSQAHSEWAHDQETAVREAVGVAKTEWEEESHKRVESALKEQEAIWQKRLDTEKAPKEGSYSQEGDVTRPPSNDQEGAVREAVRLARIEWLKERETSLATRVESAVGAAQKLWREQHLMELDKLKKQCEAERGAQKPLSLEVEQKRQVEAAVLKTRKECEQQYITRLQEALTSERQRWSEENQQKWEQQERVLIATAHKEWSTAQGSVTASEVERSRQEWEESHKQKTKEAVQEVVMKAKRHYEGVVRKLHSELARKFESQKATMAAEIRQLEERLASLLQQQTGQHGEEQATRNTDQPTGSHKEQAAVCSQLKDHQVGKLLSQQTCQQPCQCQGSHTCQISGGQEAHSSGGGEVLKGLLKDTAGSVKKDVLQLMAAELESIRKLHREEIARTRETTAQQVKQYYLQCLHQLVNCKSHDDQSQSHDIKAQHSSSKSCKSHASQTKSHDAHPSITQTRNHPSSQQKPTSISEQKTHRQTPPKRTLSTHPMSQASSKDTRRLVSSPSHVTRMSGHVTQVADMKSKVPVKSTAVKTVRSGKEQAGKANAKRKSDLAASSSQMRHGSKRNLFGTTNPVKCS